MTIAFWVVVVVVVGTTVTAAVVLKSVCENWYLKTVYEETASVKQRIMSVCKARHSRIRLISASGGKQMFTYNMAQNVA